jgi:hypothetical protein
VEQAFEAYSKYFAGSPESPPKVKKTFAAYSKEIHIERGVLEDGDGPLPKKSGGILSFFERRVFVLRFPLIPAIQSDS